MFFMGGCGWLLIGIWNILSGSWLFALVGVFECLLGVVCLFVSLLLLGEMETMRERYETPKDFSRNP